MKNYSLILIPALFAMCHSGVSREADSPSRPAFLTFGELVTLSDTDMPPPPLKEKLENLLSTPSLYKNVEERDALPHRPIINGKPALRVVAWNVEEGLQFELIKLALSDPDGFLRTASVIGSLEHARRQEVELQLRDLRDADVVVLNEVDLGMKRTGYRDVAGELARTLGMNYVFGVEFVEVDRLNDLGIEEVELEDSVLTEELHKDLMPDRSRYLGLHGNVILSRYPIQHARIFRLPICHDWYNDEKAEISQLERGKRFTANKLFLERIQREVRHGGRMALIADVKVPESSTGAVTVVNVHLENKCKPGCRAKQMDSLLSQIREVENPLVNRGRSKHHGN